MALTQRDRHPFTVPTILARYLAIAAIGGALMSFLFRGELTPKGLATGALIGVFVFLFVVIFEVLFWKKLDTLKHPIDKVVRAVYYTFASMLGVFCGVSVGAAILYGEAVSMRFLLIPLGTSAILGVVIGLSFYTYHLMKQRLTESLDKLKQAEYAEKELELARSIQQRLLPPQEIQQDGYRVSARNLAARTVAGDFYDIFHLADGSVGAVVADVSGKGMGASLVMASVKAVLPLIAAGKSVEETLNQLNEKLKRDLGKREFVALAYAHYEPPSGRLRFGNAGLPDPYLIRREQPPKPLSVSGPRLPLGVKSNVRYESMGIALEPGDRLLFLSDGLPEAATERDEPIGYEMLANLVAKSNGASGSWLDELLSSVRQASREAIEDDMTVLVIERA